MIYEMRDYKSSYSPEEAEQGSYLEITLYPKPRGAYPKGFKFCIDTRVDVNILDKQLKKLAQEDDVVNSNTQLFNCSDANNIDDMLKRFLRENIGSKNVYIYVPIFINDTKQDVITKKEAIKFAMEELTLFLLRDSLSVDILAGQEVQKAREEVGGGVRLDVGGTISQSISGLDREVYESAFNTLTMSKVDNAIKDEIQRG